MGVDVAGEERQSDGVGDVDSTLVHKHLHHIQLQERREETTTTITIITTTILIIIINNKL